MESWTYSDFIGIEHVLEALIQLLNTQIPLLELNGAVGIARCTFHVPSDCPHPKQYLNACKEAVTQQNGVKALCQLLQRLNRRLLHRTLPEDHVWCIGI